MRHYIAFLLFFIHTLQSMEAPCSGQPPATNIFFHYQDFPAYNRENFVEFSQIHAAAQEDATIAYAKAAGIKKGETILNLHSGKNVTSYLAQKIRSPLFAHGMVMELSPLDAEKDGFLSPSFFNHIFYFAAYYGVLSQEILTHLRDALHQNGSLHLAMLGYHNPCFLEHEKKWEREDIIRENHRKLRSFIHKAHLHIENEIIDEVTCTFTTIQAFRYYITRWFRAECGEPADWYLTKLTQDALTLHEDGSVSYTAPRIRMLLKKNQPSDTRR